MPSASTTNAAAAAIATKVRMLQVPAAVDTRMLKNLRTAAMTMGIGLFVATAFCVMMLAFAVAPLVPYAKYLFAAVLRCMTPPEALFSTAYEWSKEEFPAEKEAHHVKQPQQQQPQQQPTVLARLSEGLASMAAEVADALSLSPSSPSLSKKLLFEESVLLKPPALRNLASRYVRAFAFGQQF